MALKIKVTGAWKDAVPKVKVAGAWRDVSQAYVKVSGVWKELLVMGGWDILTATYNNASYDLSVHGTLPRSVLFKPDGIKMYALVNATCHQYTLSTPWNLSTATYDNISTLLTQDAGTYDIFFKPDGRTMYVIGVNNNVNHVRQYTLSTPWNLSTATYNSVSGSIPLIVGGVFFKDDGTKMYVLGYSNSGYGNVWYVYQYTLSTPWSVSTATYDTIMKNVSIQDSGATDIFFTPDGTTMYMCGEETDSVYQYTLSTPWNLSTATYDNISKDVSRGTTSIYQGPESIDFSPDGKNLYIIDNASKLINQFVLQ